jgi:hypothetical protein
VTYKLPQYPRSFPYFLLSVNRKVLFVSMKHHITQSLYPLPVAHFYSDFQVQGKTSTSLLNDHSFERDPSHSSLKVSLHTDTKVRSHESHFSTNTNGKAYQSLNDSPRLASRADSTVDQIGKAMQILSMHQLKNGLSEIKLDVLQRSVQPILECLERIDAESLLGLKTVPLNTPGAALLNERYVFGMDDVCSCLFCS